MLIKLSDYQCEHGNKPTRCIFCIAEKQTLLSPNQLMIKYLKATALLIRVLDDCKTEQSVTQKTLVHISETIETVFNKKIGFAWNLEKKITKHQPQYVTTAQQKKGIIS